MSQNLKEDFQQIYKLYTNGQFAELVQKSEDLWAEWNKQSNSEEIAECCRLTMVSHIKLGNIEDINLWYARAMARFALAGSLHGIAALMIPLAMRSQSKKNIALAILDEMEMLINKAGPVNSKSFLLEMSLKRLVHEKRAFINFSAEDYQNSIQSYTKALKYSDKDVRGRYKVNLGLSLCRYLIAKDKTEKNTELLKTRAILKEIMDSENLDLLDLERIACHNISVMLSESTGDKDNFIPYEVP